MVPGESDDLTSTAPARPRLSQHQNRRSKLKDGDKSKKRKGSFVGDLFWLFVVSWTVYVFLMRQDGSLHSLQSNSARSSSQAQALKEFTQSANNYSDAGMFLSSKTHTKQRRNYVRYRTDDPDADTSDPRHSLENQASIVKQNVAELRERRSQLSRHKWNDAPLEEEEDGDELGDTAQEDSDAEEKEERDRSAFIHRLKSYRRQQAHHRSERFRSRDRYAPMPPMFDRNGKYSNLTRADIRDTKDSRVRLHIPRRSSSLSNRRAQNPRLSPDLQELQSITTKSEGYFPDDPVNRLPEDPSKLELMREEYFLKLESGEFFNYSKPAIRTSTTLQEPRIESNANSRIAVLVMSSRANIEARQAIRESWAKNHPVYFLLGGLDKPHIRNVNRKFNITIPNTNAYQPTTNSTFKAELVFEFPNGTCIVSEERHVQEHVEEAADLQPRLVEEAEAYGDLLDVIHPDKYSSLPYKLRFGLQWATKNLESVQWIVKVDDDMIMRVQTLEKLLEMYNPDFPIVLGDITVNAKVARWNDWFEYIWPLKMYPPFPLGSFGYVMSAPVARHVAQLPESSITYYQGEDTSLGIWIDQSQLEVMWLNADAFFNNKGGDCSPDAPWLIHGHYLSPNQIRQCYEQMDEWPQRWIQNALSHMAKYMCGRGCLSKTRNPRAHKNGKSFGGIFGGGGLRAISREE